MMTDRQPEPDESEVDISSGSGGSTTSRSSFSQTYMFGAELTKEDPVYHWHIPPSDSGCSTDDEDAVQEVLKLTGVCLGVGAVPGELNLVHLVSMTEHGEKVEYAIASLTRGVREMEAIKYKFKDTIDVTLQLVEGTGPVSVTGNVYTCVNYEIDTFQLNYTSDETDSSGGVSDSTKDSSGSEMEVENIPPTADRFMASRMSALRRSHHRTLAEVPDKRKAGNAVFYKFKDGYAVRSKQHEEDVGKVKRILTATEHTTPQHGKSKDGGKKRKASPQANRKASEKKVKTK